MQVLGVWGQHLLWLQQQEWVLSEVEAEGGAPGQLSLQGLVERPHLRVEGGAACREEGFICIYSHSPSLALLLSSASC